MPATRLWAVFIGLAVTLMGRASTSRPLTRLDARPLSAPTGSLNLVFPTLMTVIAILLALVEVA